jgi:hypothetical protein
MCMHPHAHVHVHGMLAPWPALRLLPGVPLSQDEPATTSRSTVPRTEVFPGPLSHPSCMCMCTCMAWQWLALAWKCPPFLFGARPWEQGDAPAATSLLKGRELKNRCC